MKSILSGILISIGGTIYLSIENKIVGDGTTKIKDFSCVRDNKLHI